MKNGAIIFILFYFFNTSTNAQEFRSENGFPVEKIDTKINFSTPETRADQITMKQIQRQLAKSEHLEFIEESSVVLQYLSDEGFISYTRSKVLSRSYIIEREVSEVESRESKS